MKCGKTKRDIQQLKVPLVCHWFTYFYGWRGLNQISHIITNFQVSVYADSIQSVTQNCVWSSYRFPRQILLLLNQQIITEGIANDTTDYSYWDRERSLNALEREQRGRWPLIAFMQMPSAKCQKARVIKMTKMIVSITKFLNLFEPLFIGWYRTRTVHFNLSD